MGVTESVEEEAQSVCFLQSLKAAVHDRGRVWMPYIHANDERPRRLAIQKCLQQLGLSVCRR